MATYNSDAILSDLMPTPYDPGVVVCRSSVYTNSGSKAIGTIIKMVPIPEGAKLLRIEYSFSALGASCTIDIGNSSSATAYASAIDASSAVTGSIVAIDGDFTADDYVQLKNGGAAIPDAAVLKINAYYKMKDLISDES